jgi:capsular polysaccharide biosynthesis protein
MATPQRLRATLRTWFGLIIVGTILGAIVGFGVAFLTPPTYSASVTMWVTPAPREGGITGADIDVVQALMPTLAELATKTPILEEVISSTGVEITEEDLADSVTTHVPVGTSLLTITVSNPSPDAAALLANALARELTAFLPVGDVSTSLQVDLTVVDPARPPTEPDGPGILIRTALGAAIGLFMTLSFVFLIENIWPQGRGESRPASGSTGQPSPASSSRGASGPSWPSDPTRSSTIGTDPLDSRASASQAKIASRGLVNELEIERSRAIE